jgi:hypothetical protein
VAPQDLDHAPTMIRSIVDAGVRYPQVLAHRKTHDATGLGGLGGTTIGRTTRAHLATRDVDDARAIPLPRQEAHRPAGAKLDVVGVGREGEKVEAQGQAGWGAGVYRASRSLCHPRT